MANIVLLEFRDRKKKSRFFPISIRHLLFSELLIQAYFLLMYLSLNKYYFMLRNATAVWQGSGKEGAGNVSTQSGILKEANYGYKSRFENGPGTNPEELVAAAHAGCFTMKLSFVLGEAGFTPEHLQTKCDINLENGSITSSHLTVEGKVPGISNEKFQECVTDAEKNCPISKLLNTTITSEATLQS